MAMDISIPLSTTVDLVSSQADVGSLNMNAQFGVGTEPNISHFQSEAEAISALTQLAAERWSSQFGQQNYPWKQLNFDLANVSNGDNFILAASDRVQDSIASTGITNVQTSGVDEGDNVEISSDGYAFVVRDQVVRIIDVRDPSDLKEVARIDTPGYSALLHLIGNKFIVISQGFASPLASPSSRSISPFGMIPIEGIAAQQTNVTIYDVTAKNTPKKTAGFNFEGAVAASRIVNNKLVLVQNSTLGLPHLQIANQPNRLVEGADSWWMHRYETKEEYIARVQPIILDAVLLNYEEIDKDGKSISRGLVGNWHDIALAGGQEVTSVVTIDLASDAPKLGTSETILGGRIGNTYVTDSSIYLTSSVVENATQIVHFDLADNDGQLTADAVGNVKGIIRNSRFMDEFDGKLRVVTTEDGSFSGGRSRNAANLFVLQVADGELKTVGQLLDISPGLQAYGVEFEGLRAVITTGFINPVTLVRPFDPLHGIDLSDPTHPKELSDLVIPGITNYVHWVDSDHLIGVGMFEENSLWYAQVSLYEVTDLAAPKTLDVWHGTKPIQPNLFASPNALDIHFDPVSKTLTIPQTERIGFPTNWLWANIDTIFGDLRIPPAQATSKVVVLSIDLETDDPVEFLAELGDGSSLGRAIVVGDTIIAFSNLSLMTYSIEKPTQVLDRILLSNPLQPDFVYYTDDSAKTVFDVRVNDSQSFEYTITAIKGGQLRGTVRILQDQRLEYTNPTDLKSDELNWLDSFSYEVTTKDGAKFETTVTVYGQRRAVINQQTTASIALKALDAEVKPLTSTAKGDVFWVEVQVQAGNNAKGVYSAYVDLAFDTKSFEIVGDAEPLGKFTNGLSGEKTTEGWKNLGGFSDSITPPGAVVQSVVRFKLRAIKDASLLIVASTSTTAGREMTVYGVDTTIPVDNITASPLVLPFTVATTTVDTIYDYDVNADGIVSPLDSLIVINRINRESVLLASGANITVNSDNTKLDVNQDGIISLLDVLKLINRINQNPVPPIVATPMMNTQDSTATAKKSGNCRTTILAMMC